MRALLLVLLLPLNALADDLCWMPVTTDTLGRTFPASVSVTYQIYQDGKPYGERIAQAPTCDKMVSIPSCTKSNYSVTAWANGMESKQSNTITTLSCFPTSPALSTVRNPQLTACQVENAKVTMRLTTCEANLRAAKAQ